MSPDTSPKSVKEALDPLQKSLEDAASVSTVLWLSYLSVFFYIAVAVGGVTHSDLLLEKPLNLPVVNVAVPLVAFFVLAPILFIIIHSYTLVHFVILATKVGRFNDELRAQLPDAPDIREEFRRQLPSNIFAQFLAGPRDIRQGGLGWILLIVAWITLVIAPVLLLILIQSQFLPYHLPSVTWLHRCLIVADIILLWLLWPAVLQSRSKITWPFLRWPLVQKLWGFVFAGVSFVSIGLAFAVATYPGETVNDWIYTYSEDIRAVGALHDVHNFLYEGALNDFHPRRDSLFSNTLILRGFSVPEAMKIDDRKLDTLPYILSLNGRNLNGIIFSHADLRKVDLTGAQLKNASLDYVDLEEAQLGQANLEKAYLVHARLQGAQLRGSCLNQAQLAFADFRGSQLKGAHIRDLQPPPFDTKEDPRPLFKGAQLTDAEVDPSLQNPLRQNGPCLLSPELVEGTSSSTGGMKDSASELHQLLCDSPEALHIAHGLIKNGCLRETATLESMDYTIHNPQCRAFAVLTEAEKNNLSAQAKAQAEEPELTEDEGAPRCEANEESSAGLH